MKSLLIFVSAMATLTMSIPSHAMGRGSNVCEPYMAKYCGGLLQQGHDKLVACLRDHWDELSQDCKNVMTTTSYESACFFSSP